MQLHPAFWAVEPWLKYLGMMIAGIVDKDSRQLSQVRKFAATCSDVC
jgi:hypothetical protein